MKLMEPLNLPSIGACPMPTTTTPRPSKVSRAELAALDSEIEEAARDLRRGLEAILDPLARLAGCEYRLKTLVKSSRAPLRRSSRPFGDLTKTAVLLSAAIHAVDRR